VASWSAAGVRTGSDVGEPVRRGGRAGRGAAAGRRGIASSVDAGVAGHSLHCEGPPGVERRLRRGRSRPRCRPRAPAGRGGALAHLLGVARDRERVGHGAGRRRRDRHADLPNGFRQARRSTARPISARTGEVRRHGVGGRAPAGLLGPREMCMPTSSVMGRDHGRRGPGDKAGASGRGSRRASRFAAGTPRAQGARRDRRAAPREPSRPSASKAIGARGGRGAKRPKAAESARLCSPLP